MIKFFRKIRQQLLSQNRFSKYLIYAVGEIVLVVVGILIALQINAWNNNRSDRQLERQYLSSIIIDLHFESEDYKSSVLNRFQSKIEALMLAKKYAYGNHFIADTLDFLNKVGIGGVFSIGNNYDLGPTYQELISTSNFKLIKNDSLKMRIIGYYTLTMDVSQYANNLRSGYARYINSLKPFNARQRDYIYPLDINRMLNRLTTEEFIDLINQELTFAYSFNYRVEFLNQRALELKQDIEKELERLNHD